MIQDRQYTDAQRRLLTAFASGLDERGITVQGLTIGGDTVQLEYVAADPADTETTVSEIQSIAGQYLGLARESEWTPQALHVTTRHPDYDPGEWDVDEETTAGFVSGEIGEEEANERLAAQFEQLEST